MFYLQEEKSSGIDIVRVVKMGREKKRAISH
jgi:hypothetical protein